MPTNKDLRGQADERYHAKREWLDRVGAPLASESAAFEHGFDAAWKLITPLLPNPEDAHLVQNDGRETCAWQKDSDEWEGDQWDSACGEKYVFVEGGPADNGHKFCHGCGKPLVVIGDAAMESAQ